MIFKSKEKFPKSVNPEMVGKYPLQVYSGGGYFYDEVLEYRVWTKEDCQTVCYSFNTYDDAYIFYKKNRIKLKASKPLVLVKQNSYIDEQENGQYAHIKCERITEWQPNWLIGNQNTDIQIPNFMRNLND